MLSQSSTCSAVISVVGTSSSSSKTLRKIGVSRDRISTGVSMSDRCLHTAAQAQRPARRIGAVLREQREQQALHAERDTTRVRGFAVCGSDLHRATEEVAVVVA